MLWWINTEISIGDVRPLILIDLMCFLMFTVQTIFFTISMDSSGAALNQRGYREDGHRAPMNEVLAAGMVMLSGWDKKSPLVDPMCGSGTILTEAAMMAMNMGPNLKRKEFGFRTWPQYSPILFNNVKNEELSKSEENQAWTLTGIDVDDNAVSLARKALGKIGLRREVRIKTMDFREFKPINDQGMIITNPPYGERIGDDILDFYKSMGDAFKQNFAGYDAWLISSNKKALKQIGLKDSKRIKLYNGKLECDYCKYELY